MVRPRNYDIFIIFYIGREEEEVLKYQDPILITAMLLFRSLLRVLISNSPWQKCSFALSPRFHVCSFTPFSLFVRCRFRLRVLIKPPLRLFPPSLCLPLLVRPAFSSLFFWRSLWACEVSRTYRIYIITKRRMSNYRAVSRSIVNGRNVRKYIRRGILFHRRPDVVDCIQIDNANRAKKHSRIDYNSSCIFCRGSFYERLLFKERTRNKKIATGCK